jgi:hypothetical protein
MRTRRPPAPPPGSSARELWEWKSCRRKDGFATNLAAVDAAVRYLGRVGLLRIYPCPICGKQHLTKKPLRRSGL